ncbi:aldehyde dehydrogenase (NAD+) [Saccharopolyspora erythraea NRRL 2338]|uniref:Aldehyde dehydrogenase n=2 Tax=Saccharopolyspora erythraea TaxID=1836 RepID=A4FMZ7_SACEN|nr:aldehyde dehydrogenase family protein [Saccharopolyspora erythraea]EQD84907.1 aldehyde dehydrogenase [Saccharopolyspora erythraea D]PFG99064.1 aldehyde dehydrogenase (NAD+) [Saccharopolyspora erythraea NRRL 2338]QRK89028.1 aldehyde dehydrogenase family protein [Saccharopolyspora erythraea]CAM05422.1 aldehyde dehydrogenase (NAD+) [Saccharopolyspora erythraea NRRL 2338]
MTGTARGSVETSTEAELDPQPTFESLDPRTGEVVGRHPVHDAGEVGEVVAAARKAQQWWSDLGFSGRKQRLDAWRKLLLRRLDELAGVICAETGKPLDDARLELVLVVDHLHWAAANAEKVLRRRKVPSGFLMANQAATVEYLPFGVIGVIGPWNYPAFTPMGSIAYALAAGNTVVFKPSELTPGVGEWLAKSLAEVVPEQPVLSVVTGFGPTGAALCESGVDKVAFTGSTETGKRVMATCARTLTPVLVECGGKDALIVDADADLSAAADAAVWGAMSNAGQTCIGVERVYVVDAVADRFFDLVTERAAKLRPGGEPNANFGPITMPSQVDVIRDHVDGALERGARALVGGGHSVRPPFVEPVVLTDVPPDAAAATEETFGPTIVVERVRSADEGVERANDSRYGLGGTVFSRARGTELARRLRSGMVAVNSVIAFAAVPALPFGGVGDSGFGRIHGEDGLREFTRAQAVTRLKYRIPLNPMTFGRSNRTVRRLVRLLRLFRGR